MPDSSSNANPYAGLSEEEVDLLRWRASRYAQKPVDEQSDQAEVIVFARGKTRYAAALEALREIRPLRTYCPIPGAARVIPGVFHYRGEVLSVCDLSCLLSGELPEPCSDWIIVVEHADERMGLLADEVLGVEPVSAGQVKPVPISLGEQAACFQGVTDSGALLLHTARLLAL